MKEKLKEPLTRSGLKDLIARARSAAKAKLAALVTTARKATVSAALAGATAIASAFLTGNLDEKTIAAAIAVAGATFAATWKTANTPST